VKTGKPPRPQRLWSDPQFLIALGARSSPRREKCTSDKSLSVWAYSMAVRQSVTFTCRHEQMGDAIAFVFVIVTRRASFVRNVSMTLKHLVS
jgi:hypothetical protein